MGASKKDISKKKRTATIAAIVMITVVMLWAGLFLIVSYYDPVPLPILILITIPPVVVVAGIIIALRQRIKEIDGGEEDEAVNY